MSTNSFSNYDPMSTNSFSNYDPMSKNSFSNYDPMSKNTLSNYELENLNKYHYLIKPDFVCISIELWSKLLQLKDNKEILNSLKVK